MKGLIVAVFCVVFFAVVSALPASQKYTDQYDTVDVDEILKNERLRTNYYHCLKTGKKCTKEGQMLRDTLPEALKTECAKCTDAQKVQAKKILEFVIRKHPQEFKELEAIYDPTRSYRTKYAEKIKREGIVLLD